MTLILLLDSQPVRTTWPSLLRHRRKRGEGPCLLRTTQFMRTAGVLVNGTDVTFYRTLPERILADRAQLPDATSKPASALWLETCTPWL